MGVCALQEVSLHKAHISGYPKPSHVGILGANSKAVNAALTTDRRGAVVTSLLAQTQSLSEVGTRSAYPLIGGASYLPTAARTYEMVALATSGLPRTAADAWLQKAGAECPLTFATTKGKRIRGAQPKNRGLDESRPPGGAPGDFLRLSASSSRLYPALSSPEMLGEFQGLVRVLPPSFQPLGQPCSDSYLLREDAHS